MNTYAAFDVLFLTRSLQHRAAGIAAAELHLFGYLGCLLWLYQRHPLNEWGYAFVGTELGAPFSQEVDGAINMLGARGYLIGDGGRMKMSTPASERLANLERLNLNRERVECLSAACSCAAMFSLGMIGSALAEEPDLKRAREVDVPRELLEGPARKTLYEHFAALRRVVGREDADLRVPAVVWVGALYESSRYEVP